MLISLPLDQTAGFLLSSLVTHLDLDSSEEEGSLKRCQVCLRAVHTGEVGLLLSVEPSAFLGKE